MNLTPCDGCQQAAFDLHLTRYGLCLDCEAKMTHRVVIYAVSDDESIRLDITEQWLDETEYQIADLEADNFEWTIRHEMVLTVTAEPKRRSHVVLVAFEVEGVSMANAQANLERVLPHPADTLDVECWWVAMDERYDRSDNDSAVFVPMGQQNMWTSLVRDQR